MATSLKEVLEYYEHGLTDLQLESLAGVTVEQFVQTTGLPRIKLIEDAFKAANAAYEKPKIGAVVNKLTSVIQQAQADQVVVIEVSVEAATQGSQRSAGGATAYDPLAGMDDDARQATTSVYDLRQVASLRPGFLALGYEMAGLPRLLRDLINKPEGLRALRDEDQALAALLSEWADIDPAQGGEIVVPASRQLGTPESIRIRIVPLQQRREIMEQLVDATGATAFDDVNSDAAAVLRAGGTATIFREAGIQQLSNIGIRDPRTLQRQTEKALAQLTALADNRTIAPRLMRIALEDAQIVRRAFTNARVVSSFGVQVNPGENSFSRFLQAATSRYPREAAALEVGSATAALMRQYEQYDPNAFISFFLSLGDPAQEYEMAVRQLNQCAPQPMNVEQGRWFGIRQAASIFKAVLSLSIKIGPGGITVSAQAEVSSSGWALAVDKATLVEIIGASFDTSGVAEIGYFYFDMPYSDINRLRRTDAIQAVLEEAIRTQRLEFLLQKMREKNPQGFGGRYDRAAAGRNWR